MFMWILSHGTSLKAFSLNRPLKHSTCSDYMTKHTIRGARNAIKVRVSIQSSCFGERLAKFRQQQNKVHCYKDALLKKLAESAVSRTGWLMELWSPKPLIPSFSFSVLFLFFYFTFNYVHRGKIPSGIYCILNNLRLFYGMNLLLHSTWIDLIKLQKTQTQTSNAAWREF